MAEGILRSAAQGQFRVASAGSKPAGHVHPLAIKAMAEIGIDISAHTSKHMNDFLSQSVETVITVCGNADQACPMFPGQVNRYHWGFEDPAHAQGTEEEILEAKQGFLEAYGGKPDIGAVTREIGNTWSILTDMGIKLVPGGHPNHAVAEAAANAARAGDVLPEQVVEITISRPGFQGFANPQFPTDLIGIAHSAMYFAAAGAADRDYTWVHAFEEKINNPVIRGLLGKVRMIDPPTANLQRYKSGAIVTIKTKDGKSHSSTVYAPKGAAILGIDWVDVEAKYLALTPYAKLSGNNLAASMKVIRNFRDVKNVSELVELLR